MKIAVLDTVHPVLHEKFQAAGWIVLDRSLSDKSKILKEWPQYDGIVVRSRFQVDRNWLDIPNKLKFIGRSGAGLDCIDVDLAESKGIQIFNSPEGNKDAVAEHALGMLLALFHNLIKANLEVKKSVWKRQDNSGIELAGKTVGIIGYGHMGSAFAQRLNGFNCSVLAFDKYKKGFGSEDVSESSLESIFEEADIVSFHVPLTKETAGMVNYEWLKKFKKPVFIINTARGKILDTAGLVQALESGTVRGACLDVLEYEELGFEALHASFLNETFKKLSSMPNVILSPHIAGVTEESIYKVAAILADKIIEAFCPA